MSSNFEKTNWYDSKTVTNEALVTEQTYFKNSGGELATLSLGSGVALEFPTERIIFDSENMTDAQDGWAAVVTFDGRGILEDPVLAPDLDEGSQVSVELVGCRVGGAVALTVTVIGKLFDGTLHYEHLTFRTNTSKTTYNHFKEVTNVMFQNFLGNGNVAVDGYGSKNTAGAVKVTFASSFKVSSDLISSEYITEPDIIFRDYKVYNQAQTLDFTLSEAIGAGNDVDDLDVNTTTAQTRSFTEGTSSELVYGQKFKMSGNNVQKVTILLGLDSGSTWSGSLVVGIRSLLSSESACEGFLPDNEIDFDPSTSPLEEVSLDQGDLFERGIILSSTTQPVDFVFSDSQVANPALSSLVDGAYYAVTIRRTGSTSTGTIRLDEARNLNPEKMLTVFQGSRWTDVPDSSLWYRVWADSVKVAAGTAYDDGVRLPITKVELTSSGLYQQNIIKNISLTNTSESLENYLILKSGEVVTATEINRSTGDLIANRLADTPEFEMLEQDDLLTLIALDQNTVVLARVIDSNSRSNPAISGTIEYPGMAYDNVINFTNPTADLLTQNVVGSIITPDTTEPAIRYRIIKQEIITEQYGDITNNGDIDVLDLQRIVELDGYSVYGATTGTYSDAQHLTFLSAGSLNALELLRADLDSTDGYEVSTSDLGALSDYVTSGTAFPNALSDLLFVRLTLEPLTSAILSYDNDANSTLQVHVDNPNLITPANFSLGVGITFSIEFLPTWSDVHVQVLDLRRFVNTAFLDFQPEELQSVPETAGKNNFFVAGSLYLTDTIKNLDGTIHPLDLEVVQIQMNLPAGNTEGEINIFETYVAGKMKFSDGSLVSNAALNNSQARFEISISSHVKNLGDGTLDGYVDFDGYNDGYGENADEAIATYIDESTGLMRLRAFNIVRNTLFPELRTRVVVSVFLKKAGFANETVHIDQDTLTSLLRTFSPI